MRKEDIPEGVCCVCGHRLGAHLFEKGVYNGERIKDDGWRCHSLCVDGYQCECFLRKFDEDEKLEDYDLKKRCMKNNESVFDLAE